MAAPATSEVQQKLLVVVQQAVALEVEPFKAEMGAHHAAEMAALNVIIARLEALERRVAEGTQPSRAGASESKKRPVRGSRKTGAAAAASGAKEGGWEKKVTNSKLWARRMWERDPDFRRKYTTPELEATFAGDEKLAKLRSADGPKSEKELLKEGDLFWASLVKGGEVHSAVVAAYKKWEDARKLQALPEPLAVDEGADDEDEVDRV